MKLPTVGIEKCPCSESCKTYSLTGIGRFYQGSGFDKGVAEEVAMRLNAHDDLVAALRDARDELFLYVGIDNPVVDRADAALAKAGEK